MSSIRVPALVLLTLSLGAPASAQVFVEEFTGGTNEGGWVAWWNVYNTIESSGGNPGWYLHLDNLSGPATCHFVDIQSTVWPSAFSGDYRALGVDGLGLDVDIRSGAYGGAWFLVLGSDVNLTPSDTSDDLQVMLSDGQVPPSAPGWTPFDFVIPSDATTMPPGWSARQGGGLADDPLWNAVITDVDYVLFRLDTNPAAFCVFTNWDLGVDNVRISMGDLGTGYCFGDGSGAVCPCANQGQPGAGCANSSGFGGLLTPGGTASVVADDLTFSATNLLPNQPALLFSALNALNGGQGIPFGDGLRCAGGSVTRLGVSVPDAQGTAGWGPGLGAAGGWQAGDLRRFQAWYRDPQQSPCGTGFNLSNGVELSFGP